MTKTLEVKLIEGQQVIANFTLETDMDVPTLFQRMSALLNNAEGSGPGARKTDGLENVGKRYKPLAAYLNGQTQGKVTLSSAEIEKVLEDKLPATAWGDHARSFWANTETHSQGRAWLAVGWRVNGVNLTTKEITFVRA